MLEDGLKLEYDALLLATGVRYEKREFVGLQKNTTNFLFLKNFEDNQKLKKKLDKVNKLVIYLQPTIGIVLFNLDYCWLQFPVVGTSSDNKKRIPEYRCFGD